MLGTEQASIEIFQDQKKIPYGWRNITPVALNDKPKWDWWELTYADGRTFGSWDGSWAEAPQGYVKNLSIHYDHTVYDGPYLSDTGHAAFYIFLPEMGYPVHTWEFMSHLRQLRTVKFGAWVRHDYFMAARQEANALPRPYPHWVIFYADGTTFTEGQDGTWEDAPLDGVVVIRGRDGGLVQGNDYYYWDNGRLTTTHNIEDMLATAAPEIKLGTRSYCQWPPPINPQIEGVSS